MRNTDLCELLASYSRLSLSVEQRLSEVPELLSLPAKLFNQLEVLVPSFNNPREHDIHHVC